MAFHYDEHGTNNTGWIRNGDETEGWNKSKTIERMLNVFQSTFSASEMKQCLEFALAKLRRICKYLADAYNSNSHVCGLHCLTFVCENKAGKSMQWGESSFRKCIKKSSALSHIKYGKVSLQIEFATLPPKNHDLFVKEEWKGNWKNKENAATG